MVKLQHRNAIDKKTMIFDSPFSPDGGTTEFQVALIGLGQRGCEQIQRLFQQDLPGAQAFLIDHDPEYRQLESEPAQRVQWIGNTTTVPDFSACELLAIVIVGAEHHDKTEHLSLKLGLLKERPTLVLGIVLPPPAGQPARLKPELLAELDCIAHWPGDPASSQWRELLDTALTDLVGALAQSNAIPIDIGAFISALSGTRQPLRIATATVAEPLDPERVQTAARAALADLHERGFKPDRTKGLLVVIHGDSDCQAADLDPAFKLFAETLPDTATVIPVLSIDSCWQNCPRITLFAVGMFVAPPGVARSRLSP
ncbi:MAG TPA: hypothetical protein PLM32_14745 [Candidatus Competibacter sp.]|nr:hypothetical protein [Candidatus Competibacter sp.]